MINLSEFINCSSNKDLFCSESADICVLNLVLNKTFWGYEKMLDPDDG